MKKIIVLTIIGLASSAIAGKVIWSKDGKPTIEKSKKPVKGCMKPTIEDIKKGENPFQCKTKEKKA